MCGCNFEIFKLDVLHFLDMILKWYGIGFGFGFGIGIFMVLFRRQRVFQSSMEYRFNRLDVVSVLEDFAL